MFGMAKIGVFALAIFMCSNGLSRDANAAIYGQGQFALLLDQNIHATKVLTPRKTPGKAKTK